MTTSDQHFWMAVIMGLFLMWIGLVAIFEWLADKFGSTVKWWAQYIARVITYWLVRVSEGKAVAENYRNAIGELYYR